MFEPPREGPMTEVAIDDGSQVWELCALIPEAFSGALLLTDRNWSVVYLNKAAEELFDARRETVEGQSLQGLLAVSDQLWSEFQNFATGQRFLDKKHWSMELIASSPSGKLIPVEMRVSWLDPEATSRGYLVWIRDLTEEKRERSAREQMESRFRHLERLADLGKLAGSVAHDFNGFLSVIRGYCCLVQEIPELKPMVQDSLSKIQLAATRATELVQRLLAFSRKPTPTFAMLPWGESVRAMAELLRTTLGPRIELRISHESSEPCAISMDAAQVQQLVMNLIMNARDAMPQGGTISVRTSERVLFAEVAAEIGLVPGSYAVLEVVDDGPGLPDEVKRHLFEPFWTTKPPGCGTGLGLSIVKQVATNHQGGIKVSSLPGQGASFQIFLPKCR
ncbi:MAG: ATP-binding protein [bacterium]